MSARSTPGVRSTPAALDAIDATVDGRCACGCGAQLDPAGASAWFASERCQRRFHAKGATRVEEVLAPPDAAEVPVGADGVPVPLAEPVEVDPWRVITQRQAELGAQVDRVRLRWSRAWADAIRVVFGMPPPVMAAAPAVVRLPIPPPPTSYDRVAYEQIGRAHV